MKKEIEIFFGMPFEQALNEKEEFTLSTTSQNVNQALSLRAIVYFNLAKQGWNEDEDGYQEAKKDETEYLGGDWGMQVL